MIIRIMWSLFVLIQIWRFLQYNFMLNPSILLIIYTLIIIHPQLYTILQLIIVIILVIIIFIIQIYRHTRMPSAIQFLQNPEIFPYQNTLSSYPQILNALIDYLTKNPDPLIHNQQQCYVYPNKSADILSLGTTYRTVIVKKQRKNKKTNEQQSYYPYLDRMFKNLSTQPNLQESLLGYTNKVLISFAKKTPEIYEYIKDNQDVIGLLVKNNKFLKNFREFWITFIVQSTMGLYIFLKNIVIRNLMFRVIDEKDTDNLIVYETLYSTYLQIKNKMKSKILPEDQKQQLQEICANFHDQDFMSLMILKISSLKSDRSYYIGRLLNQIINYSEKVTPYSASVSPSIQQQSLTESQLQKKAQNNNRSILQVFSEICLNHMQAIQQYFESYEDSDRFMDFILLDQIQILKMLLRMSQKGLLENQHQANLMKRLLVYCSIHKRNTILHNILYKYITILANSSSKKNQNRMQIFKQINVIPFIIKNSENKSQNKYAFGSLVYRICQFWLQNHEKLNKYTNQSQKLFIKQQVQARNNRFSNLNFYKQANNKSELISQCQSREQSPAKQVQLLKQTQVPTTKQKVVPEQTKQQGKSIPV